MTNNEMPYEWRYYYEKRGLRNTSNMIGLAFILATLLPTVIMLIFGIVSGIIVGIISLGTDVYAYDRFMYFLEGAEFALISQFFLSILMFTLPFLIIPVGTKRSTAEIVTLKKVSPLLFILLVFMALGMTSLGNGASTGLNALWQAVFGRDMQTVSFIIPDNIFMKIFYVITVSIVPALVEEFAMRGLVLGSLRKYGNMFAVVMSSLLFGLMHGNLTQFVFAFITGIGLGLCVIISDSLWPAITVHFINNFMSIVLDDWIAPHLSDSEYIWMFIIYMAALFVIGLAAFIIIMVKYKKPLHEKPDTVLSLGQRTELFIVSPAMIILLLIFVAQIVILETGIFTYLYA